MESTQSRSFAKPMHSYYYENDEKLEDLSMTISFEINEKDEVSSSSDNSPSPSTNEKFLH